MARMFHLSHLLDEKGYKRIDLISFYELSKLDEYIEKNFTSHQDVRRKYDIDIGEFCLDNMKMIQDENKKNNRNWTGSIAIVCEERDQDDKVGLIYKIPIIYKNERKLLPKEDCLNKIREKLKNNNTIIEIYKKKKELLSQNERELVILYRKTRNVKYLRSASDFLKNRLVRMDNDELLYFYCRALMKIFGLNELSIKTKFGNINNISSNIPTSIEMVKKTGYSKDWYFNDLIDDENYEELFSTYDLDEIERNSNLFEERKKKQ